jgi:hypothetical protein
MAGARRHQCTGPNVISVSGSDLPSAFEAHLPAGVRHLTALADLAVKCSKKTASGITIAAESLPFARTAREITAKMSG